MKTDFREKDFCEKEQAVAAALSTGALPDDLVAHVGACAVCTEVVLISRLLSREVTPAQELRLPNAGLVWRHAQARARQQAIAKATQPIRIARIAACMSAIVALPWLVLTFLNSPSSMLDASRHLWTIARSLSGALTGTTLFGIIASLILISLSSWYVLRQE